MSRPVAVLRPEPGNSATSARVKALGRVPISLPLFEVRPLAWAAPRAEDHDALLLTSANTLRHGGAGLAALRALPVLAVGATTAAAARRAGFDVVLTGAAGASGLLASTDGRWSSILHLGGRDRSVHPDGRITAAIPVYASEPIELASEAILALAGADALLHSARAASRLAELVDQAGLDRASLRLGCLSHEIAGSAGSGWGAVAVAGCPADQALLEALAGLAD